MKVTLINHTQDAVNLLLFTKNTRLNMTPGLLEEIRKWPEEKKAAELAYMARTLPSSWEFIDYVFAIEDVTRAFTHQLVRTRQASYAQQAQRIVDVSSGNPFGYETGPTVEADPERKAIYDATMARIATGYRDLVRLGAKTEDARGLLPTNVHTNITVKFNLRTLSDVVKKRMNSGRVQDEYRAVVRGMADEVLKVHPWAEQFLFPRQRSVVVRLRELAAEARRRVDAKFGDEIEKEADILSADHGAE